MALKENDYEDYYGRVNPAKGYDAYEYSTDNKYSENSGLNKAQNFHTEFRNFENVRPFDDCEKSFPTGENFSSISHYKSSVQGGIWSQNSQTRGYLHQSNQKIQFKWFRKQSTDRVLDVEKGSDQHNRSLYRDNDNPASTDHPTVGYNQSKSCEPEVNDKSLVNCIYGNRKRNLTSHDVPPYKFKYSRGNSKSRTPVKEGGRSFSNSLTRYRRSSERSSDRHYRSRSPSSSCSYISLETDRYRETKDFLKRDYKCKSYSSSALQSFSRNSEYKSEFYRQTSRSPSYTPTRGFRNSRSSMKYNQRNCHERSRRSHHRSRSPSHSYSRSSSRNSRYSLSTWSRSSSRGSRYSSLSRRSKSRKGSSRRGRSRSYSRNRSRNRSYSRSSSRGRRNRSRSYSSSRCHSVSRTTYRSESSEIRRGKSKRRNYRSKSPMDRKASSKYTSDAKFSFGTRRSRTRSPSYSRSRRHKERDSESSLSYISSSSSRSRSQSSDGSRERTAVQKERKSRSRSQSYSSTRRQSGRHQRRDSESSLSSVSSRGSSSSHSGSRSSDTSGPRTPLCKKRKSRSRSFSKSSSRWNSQRHRSKESDSCSSISSTESTKKSQRRQMTPVHGERKSSSLKVTKTGGKVSNLPDRMRKRNEAIVRGQFEIFEEERTDEMLASVNNLLGQLVGTVTEHRHCEPVSEPIFSTEISESVAMRNQDCPKPETEYRTIHIKPKLPQEIAQAPNTKDGSNFSAKMPENLRIQLTSNEERSVICEKEQTHVAETCNAKKCKHSPEDCNKENVKDLSPNVNVQKGKRDLIPRVITMKSDQDSRIVIKKQALNSSFKTLENTSGNENQKQDFNIHVSQTNCDHVTTTLDDFAATKYSLSPHTTTDSINDKEIAMQVLELEELNEEDASNLRNSVNIQVTENQNVTKDGCADRTSVIQSVEVSISPTKQLSNAGNLNKSNSMIPVESANHEKNTHKKEDKQTLLKEKNEMAAESMGESCVAPSNSDFSDLELTSFDEFTDSDEDSSKFSRKSDNLNSGKVSSDISNIMPDPEMKTPLSNGPNIAHKHPILCEELSSVEADKERSHKSSEDRSQSSSEDNGRKVKTSTPITNNLDSVSSKISITEDNGDAVKKNLFAAISTEKDHSEVDIGLNQQTLNDHPKRRDSTESESKQTEQNTNKKQEQSTRDKDSKSDGNSQNINMDKMYRKCLNQQKNIAGEKSIQKKSHDSTKPAKSGYSKFTVEKSIKKITEKRKIEGNHTEKVPESSLKKARKNTLDFKLREVPSSVQVYKKTQGNKSHTFGEKNKEKSNILNNTHSNQNKNWDESMPKLVSRKDKNRDVSTTSIESSDAEYGVKQKRKHFPDKTCTDNLHKQRETSSTKFTTKNPVIANKTRKEQSTIADKSKTLSTLGKENSATQKTIRRLNQTSPRIKLIEQEDLFMPITPQKRRRSSGSTKSNTSDKSKQPQLTKKYTIPSTSAKSVKGPTVKTSKSVSKDVTTQVVRTPSKTTQTKKKSIDVDVTVHEKSSSSEMEIDKARIVDTDSSEIGEMEMINKDNGNKKEHGKEMSKESQVHISTLAMRRQSRAVSTEQLKVLEKNEKVRNRMCLELKQVQKRGRKMSKSGKIQKLKHKFNADLLHENFSKKHANRDEKKGSVVTHTFTKSTKEWTAGEFDKAITGEMTNKTDIVAKNILQKVPERKDTNKVLYACDKTSSKTATNSDLKSSSDKSETQISDVSLEEYRNLHEDLDLSSDDEKILPEEQASTEKKKEQDMVKKTIQNQVEEKLDARTQKEQDRERHEKEVIQDNQEEERSAGKVKRNCINQDKTSSEDKDSESMEDGTVKKSHQSYKEGEVNTFEIPVSTAAEKEDETSSQKSVCSDHPSNILSPAKPSAENHEVKDIFSINSKLCCDHIVPKTNDSIEKHATYTKILKENQSQQAFSSRSRPETPSVNITTVQAARKILPEENSPRQTVVENNQTEPQNNSQEADASSDYGTDSNRGTPYSDLSDPTDKVDHQNPVTSEKSSVSKIETNCSKKRRLIAMTLSEKQSYQQEFMDFLSKLKQEDLETFNSICFLHRKTFKGELIRNGDDNLTIGFLQPLRFRDPKLLCIRCNVCQRYFDPCDFLVHVDVPNVELNYTSCLLTEPEHAMPSMNQAEQNIWRQFIILKDFLVTAKFNSISLDLEKNDEQSKKKFSSSTQFESHQQQVSQITPDIPRIPLSTAIYELNTAETSISQFIPNSTSTLETRSCVEFVNRGCEHQDTAHSHASSEVSRQSCLFQQPSDLMTNTLMLSCSLIDKGLMSFENSSQNLNEMARRVRRTRSLTDEHLEFQNRQKRYRHQSSTLGDQQTKTNAHFDESVLLAKKLLMMQQRMAVPPHQSNPTKSTNQSFMAQRSYQFSHKSINNQDTSNSFPVEMNQHQLVPRTQPPPYPGSSVHHQTRMLSAPHNYRKESCMFQSNQQAVSSHMQSSAMNISPQPMQELMNHTPLPIAHQNVMPNNIPHTTVSPAHQNNFFIGGQSSRNAAVYPNTGSSSVISNAHKNMPDSSLHPMIPPDHVNVPANRAPKAHISCSDAPQAIVNMSANPAVPLAYPGPIPQIPPVPENLAGYRVPSTHQTTATSNNCVQNQDRSLQSNSTALNYHASKPSHQNHNRGRSQEHGYNLLQHYLQHGNEYQSSVGNQHQSSVQSCSVNQPSISKDTFMLQKEQTLINHNIPPIQTSRGESRELQMKKPEGQLQVGGQVNWAQNLLQTNCENMPGHYPSTMSLSSTNPIYLDKSTDTQNQRLQLSKNADKPKQHALEVSEGTKGSEYVAKSTERRTSFDHSAANGVAQTVGSPADAQKKMETSCMKMVTSLMWMCEEFKRNTAEVISAKQELQQWKEEIKKTVDEYHTTEALMTQKIHDVLSKMT